MKEINNLKNLNNLAVKHHNQSIKYLVKIYDYLLMITFIC